MDEMVGLKRNQKSRHHNGQIKLFLLSAGILILFLLLEVLNCWYRWVPTVCFVAFGCIAFTVLQLISGLLYIFPGKRRERYMVQKNKETAQSGLNDMVSQIRPHFIFNVLNAIGAVCLTEPERADAAIVQFSDYLRAKLLLLEGEKMIPFDMELRHIQNYVSLERLRFGNKIELILKTTCTDFMLPVLSIQPIVENAIKYGVSKRSEGGHVIIYTRKLDNKVEIIIEDDGVEYDAAIQEDPDKAFSTQDALDRLNLLCEAQTSIESVPGEGSKITILMEPPAAL